MKNKTLHMVAFLLLVIGGLNWLLVGALNLDLVMMIGGWLGEWGDMFATVVYILVGLSAIYMLLTHKADCKVCSSSSGMTM